MLKLAITLRFITRTQAKADAWTKEYNGAIALTPCDAVKEADIVFTCVGNDDDVREIYKGQHGILVTAKPGAILVDHTTASADVAREIADAAHAIGCDFLDALVSGGEAYVLLMVV